MSSAYGTWPQWRRRWNEARAENKVVSGVNCPHQPGVYMCDACWNCYSEIRSRHGLSPTIGDSDSAAECARRLASR